MRSEDRYKLVYLENVSCKALGKDRECLYNSVTDGSAGVRSQRPMIAAELTYNFVTGIWDREDGRKFKNGELVE